MLLSMVVCPKVNVMTRSAVEQEKNLLQNGGCKSNLVTKGVVFK